LPLSILPLLHPRSCGAKKQQRSASFCNERAFVFSPAAVNQQRSASTCNGAPGVGRNRAGASASGLQAEQACSPPLPAAAFCCVASAAPIVFSLLLTIPPAFLTAMRHGKRVSSYFRSPTAIIGSARPALLVADNAPENGSYTMNIQGGCGGMSQS
jgi:hypothetical protein